jgi:hypothetical protein
MKNDDDDDDDDDDVYDDDDDGDYDGYDSRCCSISIFYFVLL